MISFIVIGKNESAHLNECLNAIFVCIQKSNLKQYEIVFVDSNSTDNSIEIASSFNEVKVIKALSKINAAIARNIGAKETTGDILFFIDGDMVVNPGFLSTALNDNHELKFDFLTGNIIHIAKNQNYFVHPTFKGITNATKSYNACGAFLIKRTTWVNAGGMDSKYNAIEDSDLLFKLLQKNIFFYKLPETICIHHEKLLYTFPMLYRKFVSGKFIYRAIFYRQHLFTKNGLLLLQKSNYLKFMFLIYITIAASIIFSMYYLLFLYIVIVLAKNTINNKKINVLLFKKITYDLLRDVSNLIAFLFIYPTAKKNTHYEIIKKAAK